jgi:hypothetical protein
MELSKIHEELEKLLKAFNEHFFENKLPATVVSIQSAHGKPRFGWFTLGETWKDKEEKNKLFEISISSEYLNRSIEEISATLIHEMVHEFNYVNGVNDTSAGMKYHNKKFKKSAEEHGLIIEHDTKIGWSITSLTEESKMFISTLPVNKEMFTYARIIFPKIKLDDKYKLHTYICPTCGGKIKSLLTDGEYACVPCNTHFELEEK